MNLLQTILAYSTLAIAIGYLVIKYFVPKSVFSSKKRNGKGCGQDDCGCH